MHHPAFRQWLRSLPRTKDSARAMVYEALAAEIEVHGGLLLEELDDARHSYSAGRSCYLLCWRCLV